MTDLTIADALAVGGAQVLSLIPGSSRSGSTIMGGLLLVRREKLPQGFHSCFRFRQLPLVGCWNCEKRLKSFLQTAIYHWSLQQ